MASVRVTRQPSRATVGIPPPLAFRSAGNSLPWRVQRAAESRFGTDFSSVRVHTGAEAAASASALGAEAFTVADHTVFASGRFDPYTTRGRSLLDHELAHVAQWRSGGARHAAAGVPIAPAGGAAEVDADRAAARGGGPVQAVTEPALHRKAVDISGDVPLGRYQVHLGPKPEVPRKADAIIEFTPDAKSPETDEISIMQIAKPPYEIEDWIRLRPEDADLRHMTNPDGYHMDVGPSRLDRRTKASDPAVWPDSPDIAMQSGEAETIEDPTTKLTFTRTNKWWKGSNRGGKQRSVRMHDTPGAGPQSGTFAFETVAYSKVPPIAYGTVTWSFHYNAAAAPHITQEKADIKPGITPRLFEAFVRFVRFYNQLPQMPIPGRAAKP